MERLRGAPLIDLEGIRALGVESPEQTLVNALNAWALSVVACDSFHADVHAGNLLVLTDGRVAFIDFGIVGAIPRTTADAMLDLVKAFPAGDMLGVGRALEQMGFTKELSPEQSASFAKDIGEVFASTVCGCPSVPSGAPCAAAYASGARSIHAWTARARRGRT